MQSQELSRVEPQRDVIEWQLDEVLDISGWDVKKALQLLYKSNPSILDKRCAPPVQLLVTAELPPNLRSETDNMLEQKKIVSELGISPKTPALDTFIERSLDEIKKSADMLEEENNHEWNELNACFYSLLHITAKTLRTWERSGLLSVKCRENGYRVYDAADLKRLNIIRTLRCASYSLSAILRLLSGLDRRTAASVEAALNTPEEGETIVSVCDHLIVALGSTKADALALLAMIADMRRKYLTLH